MENKTDVKEIELLGYKIKLRPDEDENGIEPQEVIEYVRKQAQIIKERSAHLDNAQVALLVALQIGSERLKLDKEYRENIDKLHNSAKDALQYIEEVSPTTV